MAGSLAAHLIQLEQQRIDALLTVNTVRLDALHDDTYQLCNPTGTVWGKADYVQRLISGQLAYDQLERTSDIDALLSDKLAVLRYRCVISLRVDGTGIPAHECQHIDVYTLARTANGAADTLKPLAFWTPKPPLTTAVRPFSAPLTAPRSWKPTAETSTLNPPRRAHLAAGSSCGDN